jgi:hypothetical protein
MGGKKRTHKVRDDDKFHRTLRHCVRWGREDRVEDGGEDVSGGDEEGERFKVSGMKGRKLSEKRRKMEYV